MNKITLVIPAKEEAESLPKVLHELKNYDFDIKVILKQSDQKTIHAIKEFDCDIIFQTQAGYGNALIEGINSVKTEFFCIFNADGSFDPIEISKMMEFLNKENLDLVFGSRYEKLGSSDDDTFITTIGNYCFTFICKLFLNINLSDVLYTFVLGKTLKTRNLQLNRKDFTLCIELPFKASLNKLKISSIYSHERNRIAGQRKVNDFRDGFKILIYIIKIFFKR